MARYYRCQRGIIGVRVLLSRHSGVARMVTLVANKDPELFDKVRKELEYMTALKDIMKDEWEEIIRDERIQGYVESMRDDGKSDQEIINRLMLKYGLKLEDAEKYVLVPA